MTKTKKVFLTILFLFAFAFFILMETKFLFLMDDTNHLISFRKMEIPTKAMIQLEQRKGYGSDGFFHTLAETMLEEDFKVTERTNWNKKHYFLNFFGKKFVKEYQNRYQVILKDLKCFPVLEDPKGETIYFENAWLMDRAYGGKRFHEGADIMTSNNKRGYFQIVSMTDGIVEQIGWLELGGYRVGIRSESGGYFYYAHLYEYAPGLKKGDKVRAGQLIGTMGDSGYGKKEGTVGKFDVHLHVGIYYKEKGQEISVNPYFILKYLKEKEEKIQIP